MEATPTIRDGAVMTGEQSVATLGARIIDLGTLQHFQTALMNMVSKASKIGLSLPIGPGVSSPYELMNASGNLPPGRLRSEVHAATPGDQTRPSSEETPQDHPEAFERRRQKKGKEGHDPMTFTAEDSGGIEAEPNDAIVVGVQIAHRDVLRVMIDNGSSADILSARVYDELQLKRKDLEPFHMPLKGFGCTKVRSLGTVKLPVKFETAPCR